MALRCQKYSKNNSLYLSHSQYNHCQYNHTRIQIPNSRFVLEHRYCSNFIRVLHEVMEGFDTLDLYVVVFEHIIFHTFLIRVSSTTGSRKSWVSYLEQCSAWPNSRQTISVYFCANCSAWSCLGTNPQVRDSRRNGRWNTPSSKRKSNLFMTALQAYSRSVSRRIVPTCTLEMLLLFFRRSRTCSRWRRWVVRCFVQRTSILRTRKRTSLRTWESWQIGITQRWDR